MYNRLTVENIYFQDVMNELVKCIPLILTSDSNLFRSSFALTFAISFIFSTCTQNVSVTKAKTLHPQASPTSLSLTISCTRQYQLKNINDGRKLNKTNKKLGYKCTYALKLLY